MSSARQAMIVVTGAAGFIGSNVAAELEQRGLGPVVAVDWFGTGDKWRNLAGRSIAAFVRPEQLDPFLTSNKSAIRAIVHMGAISATTERDVDSLVERNIHYSVGLWDWCAANGVPLIYASSAATYGAMEQELKDDDDVAALAALKPLNAYGWSKKSVDLIFAQRYAAGAPAPPQWVGLKFFNVYGPNEYHKDGMSSVCLKLYEQLQAGEVPRLFKSYRPGIAHGDQRRDFVYVKDCARTIVDLIEKPGISGIFNVGFGRARSFLDIAQALARAMDCAIEPEFIEMPEAVRDQYQYHTVADMTKLRDLGLGRDFLSLEDGIRDYVSGYLSRSDRYR